MPDKPEDAVYVNVQVQLSTTDKNTTNENNKTDNNSTGNAITGEEHENRVNNIRLYWQIKTTNSLPAANKYH